MMADLLEVGVEFESFDAFQAAMEQYEDSNFVQFSRIDSRSVEKAQETTPTKMYNPVIQFVQLTYACTFGPRKVASKSSGIRNSSSRKIDCPVRLRISSSPDGQRLVIRESKLDGHNHEVSEELYKSMSRQKQLDDETEMEIYNLITMHNDKRLARMLVRDRLTQEIGRSISIKDILNIEKKISRRLEREKMSETSVSVTKTKEQQEEGELGEEGEALGEGEGEIPAETKEATLINEESRKDGEEEEQDIEQQEQQEDEAAKPDGEAEDNSDHSEVAPPPKKTKKESTPPSIRRPQRHRREPSRFRDALINGTKVLHTSQDNVVSIISQEEAELIESEVSYATSRPAAKVKLEPGVRGRKRKVGRASDVEDESEDRYRQRKLAIQEEMLEMERKKMKMLEEIVQKLDLIIQNQKKDNS